MKLIRIYLTLSGLGSLLAALIVFVVIVSGYGTFDDAVILPILGASAVCYLALARRMALRSRAR